MDFYQVGAGASTRPLPPAPGRLLSASPAPAGAGARSAGRALRVHQQPLHSAGAPMLAPVLLHSAAGPLSAAASLPTPGPHRWQLLRATTGGHRLRAVVGAPVRPSGPSHPPPAASGPHPCPPWAACRRPPRPSPCGGWPGECAAPGRAPVGPGPVKLGRSRCTGAPLRNARPSPCGAACSGP